MVQFDHINMSTTFFSALSSESTTTLSHPQSTIMASMFLESSPISITNYRLIRLNYLQYKQSDLMFLSGRGKEDFVDGKSMAPEQTNSKFKAWTVENNHVMLWLINSVTTDVGKNFILCPNSYGMRHLGDSSAIILHY